MSAERNYVQTLLEQLATDIIDAEVLRMIEECDSRIIHPIFRRDRWDIEDIDYLRIGPALVLVSHLLTCDGASHFWHAFWFGRYIPVLGKHGVQRVQFHPIHDTTAPLPPVEKAKVLRLLEEMSLAIRLRFEDIGRELGGRCCMDRPLQEIPFFVHLGSVSPKHYRVVDTKARGA
ncbi:hypothetical protein CLAFUW4_00201 [Fulvia fulva]|uniref:Uncharacterized protein n=1 Tax=Passalora fulva TaxID=5499 RepID=A0A9Q8L747_PASFU|nr:uncharacterized protein CLAFUR5_00201 [Fulvia fulva]KAK4636231.1 hypothetical protein CLAFUR4_00201 [Fulvia fulva]KAK4636945.1 hypothetical protein CLAFUR0_00202 [Fulvia fulva]UJO12049.1 hypothetical protein CLAFUR5_00201 [Fulvia fulva]WPV08397.1 hypothetical protein CLAFUW4_00201 [Fulvia fulva]WPV24840.1 hypothetical protein CLAFUW7_00204 [Fulvia fulva]